MPQKPRRSTQAQPELEAAVSAFLAECRRRNLSAGTLETYRTFLIGGRARTLIDTLGIRTVGDVTAATLGEMERRLLDAGLSASTVHVYHRTWRTFAAFCRREGWMAVEDAAKLREMSGPRLAQEEPPTINEAEERILLAACKNPRDRFLLEFMIRTGLRLAEVCAVTLDDVIESPSGTLIRVRQGKGRKDRAVPLDTPRDRFSRRLRDYVARVRPETHHRELFIGRAGEPLREQGVYSLFRRLSQETGIAVHPHSTRHTFATRSLQGGVNMEALRRALGHSTMAMVSRYAHYSHADLLDAWRRRSD